MLAACAALSSCSNDSGEDAARQSWVHFDLREVQVDVSGLKPGVQEEEFDTFLFFGNWATVGPNLQDSFEVMKVGGGKIGNVDIKLTGVPGFPIGRHVTFSYSLPEAGTYLIRARTDGYKFKYAGDCRLPDPLPSSFAMAKFPPNLMTAATEGGWCTMGLVRTVGSCPHVTAIYLDRKPANSAGEISRWSIELSEEIGNPVALAAAATIATGSGNFANGLVAKAKSHPRVIEVTVPQGSTAKPEPFSASAGAWGPLPAGTLRKPFNVFGSLTCETGPVEVELPVGADERNVFTVTSLTFIRDAVDGVKSKAAPSGP